MKVYLVRHTSVEVPQGVCYGQTDVAVKPTFPQEAAAVSQRISAIRDLLPDGRFGAVFCSPLSRCVKLAAACGYPDAVRDRRIMEIDFGEWEFRKFDEIDDPRLQEWYADYLHVRATGGECFLDQMARVTDFLQEQKASGKDHVLVFAHGGVLICAKIFAGLVDREEAFYHLDDYGTVISIDI